MSLNDHPKLKKAFDKLMAEKEAIRSKSMPLRAKRDKLQAKVQPMEGEMRALNQKIKALEMPDLSDIDIQLSAIAKAAGGHTVGK